MPTNPDIIIKRNSFGSYIYSKTERIELWKSIIRKMEKAMDIKVPYDINPDTALKDLHKYHDELQDIWEKQCGFKNGRFIV